MKRSAAWVLVGLSLGAAVYFGRNLGAVPAPSAPQTRVAVLNLRWVIKNYDRYQRFIEVMKKEEKKFVDIMQAKQQQLENLNREAQSLQGPQREAKEKEIRDLERDMEGLKAKV